VRIAPCTVNLTSVEALKTIYGSRESFRKSPFYRLLAVPGQQGLFNTVDVEFHRRHRRLLAGPMAESSLQSMLPVIEARLALTLSKIKKEMASRGAADVFKWWLFMATDIIGELTFGDSFRMLELGHASPPAINALSVPPLTDSTNRRTSTRMSWNRAASSARFDACSRC